MIVPVLLAVLARPADTPVLARPILTSIIAQPADTSIVRLPVRIVHDVRRLGGRAPLVAIAAGGIATAAARPADARTLRSLGSSASADTVFDAGDIAGRGTVQFGAAGAVYLIGRATHSQGTARLGTSLLEAQAVEGIVTEGLKYGVRRTRPDGGHHSFPSGHSSSAFATAEILRRRYGWKAGLPAYVGAAYIAVSRVAERQHYLTDVVFGAAIGIAAAHTPGAVR